MHGTGTKQGITTSSPAPSARLLDLTRSIRRVGRGPTGIDRVELAYLNHLLCDPVPLFGIIRTRWGYLLLDQAGCSALRQKLIRDAPWGPADLLSIWPLNRDPILARAEAAARRLSCARCRPGGLPAMLKRVLPAGAGYLNVGHGGLGPSALAAIRSAGLRVTVLLHDVIPHEHPTFQREGTVPTFRKKLQAVAQNADLVLYNSADTRRRAEAVLSDFGPLPDGLVAHLGVTVPSPAPSPAPVPIPEGPYFMALGTIEPRKNHALLLEVWDLLARRMAPDEVPRLMICGARGWRNEAVFARLDALPPGSPISEHGDLDDSQIATLLTGATGLLQPSFAEGFGLPVVEAAALGTRVLCLDLPAYREILGNIPVYLAKSDRYLWAEAIETLARGGASNMQAVPQPEFKPPSWSEHFNAVLRFA